MEQRNSSSQKSAADSDHEFTNLDEASGIFEVAGMQFWAKIREHHPEVPVVVLLAAPSPRRELNVLGHFSALRWSARQKKGDRYHEVVVVAEHLDREAEAIVGTLIHEAVHALNFERRIFDCSRSQYHNRLFRAAAEELGLEVEQMPHYGFAKTKLSDQTFARYADEITRLNDTLVHRRKPIIIVKPVVPKDGNQGEDATDNDDEKPISRNLKAICQCTPPFIIRVSRSTLAATRIVCEKCGGPFHFC